MTSRIVKLIAAWSALAALYVACTGTISVEEAVAAVLCGALGTVWVHRILCCGEASIALDAASGRSLLAAFAQLPRITARVGGRLLHAAFRGGVSGEVRPETRGESAADPVGRGAQATGRRAVSVIATSLSPDSFVLRLDRECGRMVVHALLSGRPR